MKHKNVLKPPIPFVGDKCQVYWNGIKYTAKLLAMGDKVTAKKVKDLLKSMEPSDQSDEENQPPKKKRHMGKEKKTSAKNGQRKRVKLNRRKSKKVKRSLRRKGKKS